MAKWLVTGGSGFLGINFIRYLVGKNDEVISLDKEPFDYPDMKGKIRAVLGDIRDKKVVDECMEGVDVVMHGAAALPLYSKQDIMTTNIDGTRLILQSAYEHGVKKVVYISSTAVYGIPDHHPIYEKDRLIGVGPYGESKIKAEEICQEFRQKGMCVPVVRPKSFIGPERLGVFAIFYEWASEGRSFPMIGKGNNRYQLLDVEDLCEAVYMLGTATDYDKINTVFNIGAEDFTTMREDYQVVLDYGGYGRKIKPSPAWFVIFALTVLEKLRLSSLYPWVYKTASKDSFVSVEKAKRILGFVSRYSNKDALLRNYKWYLENKQNLASSPGISHRVPWKQGILRLAKVFF